MSSSATGVRACAMCGTRLGADNIASFCSPCGRQETGKSPARRPPVSLWKSPDVDRAVERRDFGLILKAVKASLDPPATQSEIGEWLGLSQAQVSRIESGRTVVNDLAKLVKWAQILGAPHDRLWFFLPISSADVGDESTLPPVPAAVLHDWPDSTGTNGRFGSSPFVGRRLVGPDESNVVREATRAFRQIDNRFGGGHVRAAVSAYLDTEIGGVLADGRFAKGARPGFARAAAETYQLAGWMSYDMGDDALGRKHLRQALELANSVGDDALTAEMLAAMSHQAAFSRRANEAIDLALAARRSAHRSGAPALQAESAALEAQGLALKHDARGCIAALRRAENLFLAATEENTPPWLRYFDRAYLSAKFAQALRDLGRPSDAERFARDSLQMSDGYDRGRLFNTALLASILADGAQVDEAVVVGRDALSMAGHIRSVRAQSYLRDVSARLIPFTKNSAVKKLRRDILHSSAAGIERRQR
jgi:hypothetical protein